MSLLDELKHKADQQKNQDEESAIQARREAVYQQRLKPRMNAILKYLVELTEQLELVDAEVCHDYTR